MRKNYHFVSCFIILQHSSGYRKESIIFWQEGSGSYGVLPFFSSRLCSPLQDSRFWRIYIRGSQGLPTVTGTWKRPEPAESREGEFCGEWLCHRPCSKFCRCGYWGNSRSAMHIHRLCRINYCKIHEWHFYETEKTETGRGESSFQK